MNIRAVTMSTFSLGGRLVGGVFSMSMMFMAARVVGLVAGFGAQILLARMLAPEGLGIFYFATSIAYVVSMVAAFGYPVIAVRFISRYRTRGNDMLKSAFVNRAQSDTAIVSFAIMAVVLILTAIIPGDTATRLAIAAAAPAIPALALSRIYGSVAGAIREFALSYMLNLLWRPLLFLAVMGLIGLVFALPSPLMAACAFSFVSVAIVTLQFAGLAKHFPGLAGSATPADRRVVFQWRVASAPLLILAAFSTMINDLNLALLGTIVSKSDLAVFGVCLKLALIVEYAVSLIHELAAPDVSDALARKQTSTVDAAIARVNFMAVVATLLAVVGVIVLGRFVLSVFGPDFVHAYPILLMLVVSQFIRAAFGPSMLTLIAAGAQKSVVKVFSVAIVGFAVANIVLVPIFGLIGAGVAFVVMTAFWTASLALIAKRRIGLRLDIVASIGILRQNPMSLVSFIGGAAARSRN
ncbi:MAG: polysaccharide biosynthesis related protein [Rhizobium sp.]|nr:polysaccharide biosynthesis related protein [Rhizobium sp.]